MLHHALRYAVLAMCAAATVGAQTARPAFAVVSVRPVPPRPAGAAPTPPTRGPLTGAGRFYRGGESVSRLMQFAYGVSSLQLSGGPDWIRNEYFTIEAATGGSENAEQMRPMVQSLLEDRFKLVARREKREMRHAALVMARNDRRPGPQLERCADPAAVTSRPIRIPLDAYPIPFSITCEPMSATAVQATIRLGTLVVDETSLPGLWRFAVMHAREETSGGETPPFSTVPRDELGLKLEQRQGPVEVIVIDSIERPSEN